MNKEKVVGLSDRLNEIVDEGLLHKYETITGQLIEQLKESNHHENE
ncbi:hypothetical protein [Companilactobacillus furfuricola]|nr:hypothetical protein [Companilactobacillus furfuricola]